MATVVPANVAEPGLQWRYNLRVKCWHNQTFAFAVSQMNATQRPFPPPVFVLWPLLPNAPAPAVLLCGYAYESYDVLGDR